MMFDQQLTNDLRSLLDEGYEPSSAGYILEEDYGVEIEWTIVDGEIFVREVYAIEDGDAYEFEHGAYEGHRESAR